MVTNLILSRYMNDVYQDSVHTSRLDIKIFKSILAQAINILIYGINTLRDMLITKGLNIQTSHKIAYMHHVHLIAIYNEIIISHFTIILQTFRHFSTALYQKILGKMQCVVKKNGGLLLLWLRLHSRSFVTYTITKCCYSKLRNIFIFTIARNE